MWIIHVLYDEPLSCQSDAVHFRSESAVWTWPYTFVHGGMLNHSATTFNSPEISKSFFPSGPYDAICRSKHCVATLIRAQARSLKPDVRADPAQRTTHATATCNINIDLPAEQGGKYMGWKGTPGAVLTPPRGGSTQRCKTTQPTSYIGYGWSIFHKEYG